MYTLFYPLPFFPFYCFHLTGSLCAVTSLVLHPFVTATHHTASLPCPVLCFSRLLTLRVQPAACSAFPFLYLTSFFICLSPSLLFPCLPFLSIFSTCPFLSSPPLHPLPVFPFPSVLAHSLFSPSQRRPFNTSLSLSYVAAFPSLVRLYSWPMTFPFLYVTTLSSQCRIVTFAPLLPCVTLSTHTHTQPSLPLSLVLFIAFLFV